MEQTHAKHNRIFAILVFVFAFIVFILTTAPTVAFWDCGEYIAAGETLGIPHPPGNPLFIMMLRVSSILMPFFEDVGYRMNVFVAFTSALCALFMYLIAVRISIAMVGVPDTTWKRITVYTGGVVAGLFSVFGSTFWFSAVEASEANPSMLFVAISTWLALKWAQSDDPKRDKLLVLLAYVSFLGIGVHMYSMIALPPIFLLIILVDKEKRYDWRVWLTAILIGIVIMDLWLYIWVGLAAIIVTLIMSLFEGQKQAVWRFCFWVTAVAMLGFSANMYIPIRSTVDPMIDENDPETFQAFRDYLQRKQYGSQNMITRMFHRRGTWENQFLIEGHMGYGGFHFTQFFRFDKLDTERGYFEDGFVKGMSKVIIYLIPTFMMLYAWYYLYRRNKNLGIFLMALFLLCSIGLVFYMNFADGTRPEYQDYMYWMKSGKQGPMPVVHREVRVRDYFWGAAFMFLGMWVGVAASAIMHALFTNKNKTARKTLAPIMAVLFMVSPALPLTQNWDISSRRGDWVPYDYAYNLLNSCEKNGVIFTNGDNDTFPLWALQEAYGVRKDVRIVNLSLVNTKWYIKQLKTLEPRVPISYSEDQIDALRHSLNPIAEPTKYRMPSAGITVDLPTRGELNALRVQDQMVVNIVDANKWQKPVYFAVTVSDNNLMGLGPYLQMQGLVYRVMPEIIQESERLDIARTVHLLDNVYQFRSMGDNISNLNETSEKLLTNYAASFIQVALTLRNPLTRMKSEIERLKTDTTTVVEVLETKEKEYKDTLDLVIGKLDQCIELMPDDWRPRVLRHETLLNHDRAEEAEAGMRDALKRDPDNLDYQKMLVQALEQNGKKKEATEILNKLLNKDVDPWYVHATLAKNYEELGMLDSAQEIMRQFSLTHPGDRRASAYIEQIENLKKKSTDTGSVEDSVVDTNRLLNKDSLAEKGAAPKELEKVGSATVDSQDSKPVVADVATDS